MRRASLLLAVLGSTALIGAAMVFSRSGATRAPSVPAAQRDSTHLAAPAAGSRAPSPEKAPGEPPLVRQPPSSTEEEQPVEAAASGALEPRARGESVLVFRVVDARTGQPLTAFEARLGQAFLRPLLDERGRIRHDFPDGEVRFPGLIEAREGESVQLAILARGYQELRVPDLYVAPGGELDLGTLRLERVPRILVRVVDDLTGEPVPGARVALIAAGGAPQSEASPPASAALDPWSARTDQNGVVLLTSRPGEQATLSVRHATHAALDVELLLPLSEEHQETVRLKARLPE